MVLQEQEKYTLDRSSGSRKLRFNEVRPRSFSMSEKYMLKTAIHNVVLPGHPLPNNGGLYGIFFKDNREINRGWLPEDTIVEDPGDELSELMVHPLPRNPLKVVLP